MNEKMKNLETREKQFEEYVNKQKAKFEDERRKIREEERRNAQTKTENFLEDLTKNIAQDYNMSVEQAKIVVDKAWERGHSWGFEQVKNYAEEYGVWVEKILEIQQEMDY